MKCSPEKEESARTLSRMFVDTLSDAVFTAVQFCHYAGLRIDVIAYAIGKATASHYHHLAEQSELETLTTDTRRLQFLQLIRNSITQGFTDYIEDIENHQDLKPNPRSPDSEQS